MVAVGWENDGERMPKTKLWNKNLIQIFVELAIVVKIPIKILGFYDSSALSTLLSF